MLDPFYIYNIYSGLSQGQWNVLKNFFKIWNVNESNYITYLDYSIMNNF